MESMFKNCNKYNSPLDKWNVSKVQNMERMFESAIVFNKNINIKSNGTPWRPLIDVYDMARAFLWGIEYTNIDENYICVNVGSNEWNYRVIELAKKVIT